MKKHLFLIPLIAAPLWACSSSDEHQRNLELLADSRANLISSSLPLEAGPLTILQASAKGDIVQLLMMYDDDNTRLSAKQLYLNSVLSLCLNKTIQDNLAMGLRYHINIRNARGQKIVNETLTQDGCGSHKKREKGS